MNKTVKQYQLLHLSEFANNLNLGEFGVKQTCAILCWGRLYKILQMCQFRCNVIAASAITLEVWCFITQRFWL